MPPTPSQIKELLLSAIDKDENVSINFSYFKDFSSNFDFICQSFNYLRSQWESAIGARVLSTIHFSERNFADFGENSSQVLLVKRPHNIQFVA